MVSASDPASALALLFALLIGHALADFPLQGEFIANGKNRHLPAPKLGDGGEPPKFLWIYLMSAHSLIHAGFVWAITGSMLLGFAEFVIHWAIDSVKMRRTHLIRAGPGTPRRHKAGLCGYYLDRLVLNYCRHGPTGSVRRIYPVRS